MRPHAFVAVVAAAATSACLSDLPRHALDSDGVGSQGDGPSSGPLRVPPAPGIDPDFGETARHYPAPPPLSGGTLATVPGRATIVAADPDRDVVYVVDLGSSTVATVALDAGDEPGRVVVDGSRRAHVALRSGGALATIDLANGNAVTKRNVCSLPRGVAWDEAKDEVHVACAGGELVSLPASGGPPTRVVQVIRDLRDVIVTPLGLVVSTFRDADVIRLAADGSVQAQSDRGSLETRVAWRIIALPDTVVNAEADPAFGIMMIAQRTPSSFDTPPPAPAEYYQSTDGCKAGGPLTVVGDRRAPLVVPNAVLPIDIATDGNTIAVVSAGNAHVQDAPQIVYVGRDDMGVECAYGWGVRVTSAEITSVVYEPITARFYAFSREPADLVVLDRAGGRRVERRISLSAATRRDTGHAIFHASSGRAGVACASCHPEGREDGHSWRSLELGPRRTPSLLGTVAGTAPYHWSGDLRGLDDVMTATFSGRMRGPSLVRDQRDAISSWLVELPALRRSVPESSVAPALARGRAIFESASARCSSCHSGAHLTDNASVDVGTGGSLQVPSLIGVAHRAPYLHDGSRSNLRAVLYAPHGGAVVADDEIEDLVVFLESL